MCCGRWRIHGPMWMRTVVFCFNTMAWKNRSEPHHPCTLAPPPCIQGWYNGVHSTWLLNIQLLTKSSVESIDKSNTTLVSLGHCGVSQLSLLFCYTKHLIWCFPHHSLSIQINCLTINRWQLKGYTWHLVVHNRWRGPIQSFWCTNFNATVNQLLSVVSIVLGRISLIV